MRRSRMSNGRRFFPDLEACAKAEALSASYDGGTVVSRIPGRWETEAEQRTAIEFELAEARDELQRRLGTTVDHVCMPWGVSGDISRETLERLGFRSAFANRWSGSYVVASGDDPFYLKRLNGRHLFALPGKTRKTIVPW
jgi:hypothetical protein